MTAKRATPITITTECSDFLASCLDETPGRLYPFAPTRQELPGPVRKALAEGGVIDKKGRLVPAAAEVLTTLARATATARFRLLVEGDLMEYQVFFGPEGGLPAALRRSPDAFLIEAPAPTEALLETITDFVGSSLTGVVPSLGELPLAEALVALAVADRTRHEFFGCLSDDSAWRPLPATAPAIASLLARSDLNSGWLTWLLQTLLRAELPVDAGLVDRSLRRLAEGGLLETKGDGFIPGQPLVIMSRRLLLLNNLFRVDAARVLADGAAVRQTFGMAQNGPRDILFLETTDDRAVLAGLSGRDLQTLLARFLTDPEAVLAGERKTAGAACPGCQAPIEPGDQFCSRCGKPVAVSDDGAKFCRSCGKPLRPDKPFCAGCGTPCKG